MGLCFGCFDGGNKRMTKEEERLASEEARARAAEAAQKKQDDNSQARRSTHARQEGTAKESPKSHNGEPAVKI